MTSFTFISFAIKQEVARYATRLQKKPSIQRLIQLSTSSKTKTDLDNHFPLWISEMMSNTRDKASSCRLEDESRIAGSFDPEALTNDRIVDGWRRTAGNWRAAYEQWADTVTFFVPRTMLSSEESSPFYITTLKWLQKNVNRIKKYQPLFTTPIMHQENSKFS